VIERDSRDFTETPLKAAIGGARRVALGDDRTLRCATDAATTGLRPRLAHVSPQLGRERVTLLTHVERGVSRNHCPHRSICFTPRRGAAQLDMDPVAPEL
jgi:hypothetical protein